MEAGRTCPECGSSELVDDDLLVCTSCGSVLSEGVLTTDRNEELQGTAVRYSQTTAVDKQPCKNQIRGVHRLRALCRILRLNSELEELAESYFKRAYEHEAFIKVSLHKKEALVGCCVLVSCRLRNFPITMATISSLLEADPILVARVYQDLVKTLNIEASSAGITDILGTHAQEYKLGSDQVSEELSVDRQQLTRRAVALVELAADTWIVTGRHPVAILMAAVFLAWQSLRPTKTRLKYTLDRFCRLAKVTKNKSALKRVAEVKTVLCTLAQEIPWLRSEVTADTVMHHVEDILECRAALMRRALRSHEETLLAKASSAPEEPQPGHQDGSEPCQGDLPDPQASTDPSAASSGETKTHGEEQSPSTESQPQDYVLKQECLAEVEPNWGKRVAFAPPCVKHPKMRRVDRGEQKEVTGDEEISDSEIESYLRTPQEVRLFAQTQKVLLAQEEEP